MKLSTVAALAGGGWLAWRAYEAHHAGVPYRDALLNPFTPIGTIRSALELAHAAQAGRTGIVVKPPGTKHRGG
jgi:hypothetical protein